MVKKIEVVDGKWSENGIILDYFINTKREIKTVLRSKIDKSNNYEFKNR